MLKYHGLNIPLVVEELLEVDGCCVALPLSCATDCGACGAWEEDAQYVTAVPRPTDRPAYVEVKSVSDYYAAESVPPSPSISE